MAAAPDAINACSDGCFGDEEPDDHCCCCFDNDDADACSGGAGGDGDVDTTGDYGCDDEREKEIGRAHV